MNRPAFGLLEMLLVIGILSAVTSFTVPMYREYQIRSDLDHAAQLATQGLSRAKLLSQSGEQDSEWGFYIPSGTLYKGTGYAERDQRFDEVFPMPSTIAISGIFDVSYSRIDGKPSTTGSITLRALNNDERVIYVTIAVDSAQIVTNESDTLTICHQGQTIVIPEATWPSHQSHGDSVGTCPGASSSSVAASSSSAGASSSAASSVSSSVASSSSSTGGGGGGGGGSSSSCTSKFTFASSTQKITTTASTSVTFKNLLSQITYGSGGPVVSVHACYSTNDGSSWSGLYGGSGNCKGTGNAYGNAVKPNGTDTATVSIASGKKVALKIAGRYKHNGWLAFDESYTSVDQSGHVLLLQDGANLSDYSAFGNQTPLKNYLQSKGMIDAQGNVDISACEILAITELGTLGVSAADFQDDVLLMTFN